LITDGTLAQNNLVKSGLQLHVHLHSKITQSYMMTHVNEKSLSRRTGSICTIRKSDRCEDGSSKTEKRCDQQTNQDVLQRPTYKH